MAKVRNEIEQKAYDLLNKIPAIECDTVTTRPYYKDNRTAKFRICEINGELWVPLVDLSYGTPRLAQIHNLRKTGNLTMTCFHLGQRADSAGSSGKALLNVFRAIWKRS